MPRMIFVNLPVADVATATAFYEAIGFEKNEAFSNAQASAMVWSDTIHVMLLDHDFYATFTDKRIIDARTESGVLMCLSFDEREAVDDIHRKAVAAGGREMRAIEDQGVMYGGAFDDPDGHGWETLWMDVNAATGSPAEQSDVG
ncbi:VOC family protein [Roseovarius sp. D0-M9]|uniref:VOC family protein n=1 Tax=Roseovarius sp. D0-M9 TaxID=3127117 RepID=UPI00300F86B7